MRIAFYAPLKAPDHPVASGDRTVGRSLIQALEAAGHEIETVSRFRSFDSGSPERQQRLEAIGSRLADRLASRLTAGGRRPDLWFTYHLYHKAPDWLGPRVAEALRIPYVVAEASFAPKQQGGRWDRGHRAVGEALGRASRVFALNPADTACIQPLLRSERVLVPLPPFVDARWFAATRRQNGGGPATVRLLTVAMMRHDQKLRSYLCLAEALSHLTDFDWRLTIVGYGPAESDVRSAFAPFGDQIAWIGAVAPADLRDLYAAADLFVWPAIKEAWGMVFLEAQAAGTPVVAGRSGGVPSIVADGVSGLIAPMGDAAAFAACLRSLMLDPERRGQMGSAAARLMQERHDISVAAAILDRELRAAVAEFTA